MEKIGEEEHENHHEYLRVEIKKKTEWDGQWTRIWWALIMSVVVSGTLSIFGFLWWAVKVFIERGGK